ATNFNSSGIYLNWLDCQVTNQYDASTILYVQNVDPAVVGGITNNLGSGQVMVAPPGTAFVQYRLVIMQGYQESGATYWDDCDLELVGGPAASVIGNFS